MQKFLDSNSLESLSLDEPESEYVSYMQKFLDSNSLESLDLDEPESEYGLIHEVLGTQHSKPQFHSRSSILKFNSSLLKMSVQQKINLKLMKIVSPSFTEKSSLLILLTICVVKCLTLIVIQSFEIVKLFLTVNILYPPIKGQPVKLSLHLLKLDWYEYILHSSKMKCIFFQYKITRSGEWICVKPSQFTVVTSV
jgi:hypothetical protein